MNSSTKHNKDNTPAPVCDQVLTLTSSYQDTGIFQINLDIKESDNTTPVASGQVSFTFSNGAGAEYATYNIGDDIKTATPVTQSANWSLVVNNITNNPLAQDTETILFDKWNYAIDSGTIKFDNTSNSYPLDITMEFTPDGVCFVNPATTSLPLLYQLISRQVVADGTSMARFNTADFDPILLENDSDTISGATLLTTTNVDNIYLPNAASEVYAVARNYNTLSTFYSDNNPATTGAYPLFTKSTNTEYLFQQKVKWTDGFFTGGRAYNEQLIVTEPVVANWQNVRFMFTIDNKIDLNIIRDIELFVLNQNRQAAGNFPINLDVVADFTNSDSQLPPVGNTPISNLSVAGISSISHDFLGQAIVGEFFRLYVDGAFNRYNNAGINYLLRSYVDVKLLSA